MTQRYEAKPGSRKRALKYKLSSYVAGGAALAGATVAFQMMDANRTLVVSGTGTVLDEDGIVSYEWANGDLDLTPATYYAEFEITYSDGLKDKAPSSGYIEVLISPEVPDA